MKYLVKTLPFLFIIFFLTNCKKNNTDEHDVSKNETVLKDTTFSDCKNHKNNSSEQETFSLKFINSNEFGVKHKNTIFNCCPGKLYVVSGFSGDSILINEKSTETSCYCQCPYDINFAISRVSFGNYIFLIKKNDKKHFEFKINLDTNTDTIIIIN